MAQITLITFILLILGWCVIVFNSMVRSRNRASNGWAQIDVQLKRRHDLIPNLVRVVDRYLVHERDTLQAVINARRKAITAAEDIIRRAETENNLTRSLRSLYAVMEDYPDLKADMSIRDLMEQLTTTENRIAFARQHYNDSVLIINNLVESFPKKLIASSFGFSKMDFFDLENPKERTPTGVEFKK